MRETRPRVGITAWRRALPTFLGEQTDLYTLGTEYVDSIHACGGLAVIVPHGDDSAAMVDMLDGLVLSGGDDIDPSMYGEMVSDAVHGTSVEADRWEIALVREAHARRMPVLGICRGMQIMAVALGGRLVQHLQSVEGHVDVAEMTAEQILAERHLVTFASNCAVATVYGVSDRFVNTIHHQAVVDPGQLRVVGRGPGNVIEAVEPDDGWPAVGIQWHPEKLDDVREENLFRHFLGLCEQYRSRSGSTTRVRGLEA